MRLKSILSPLSCVLAAFISMPLVAQTETAPAPAPAAKPDATETQDKAGAAPVASAPVAKRSSSEDNRGQGQFSAGMRAGLMYTLVPGIGVEGSYHLGPNLLVGLSVNAGKLNVEAQAEDASDDDDDDDDVNLDEADLRAQSIGVQVRWFPLNSLYVLGGLSHRTFTTEFKVSDATNSANFVKTSSDSKSVCLDLGLGNQWSFDSGFYIGAEWIGASIALAKDSNANTETGGAVPAEVAEAADDNEDFAKQIGEETSLRLAMLHLGWTF